MYVHQFFYFFCLVKCVPLRLPSVRNHRKSFDSCLRINVQKGETYKQAWYKLFIMNSCTGLKLRITPIQFLLSSRQLTWYLWWLFFQMFRCAGSWVTLSAFPPIEFVSSDLLQSTFKVLVSIPLEHLFFDAVSYNIGSNSLTGHGPLNKLTRWIVSKVVLLAIIVLHLYIYSNQFLHKPSESHNYRKLRYNGGNNDNNTAVIHW